jgi:hypothetical protein
MITFTTDEWKPNALEVKVNEPYGLTDKRTIRVRARHNAEIETGAVVELNLSEQDALALFDYLKRALNQ